MEGDCSGGGGSNSSPWVSVLNVCNTAIGAGVLSFPYAFRQTGLLGGIVLTILAWLIEVAALCVLVQAPEQYKCKTYQQLVVTIFGRGMGYIISLMIFCLCSGAMISYLIITGDVFEPVFASFFGETSPFADRRFPIIIFAFLVALPLSLKTSLKELKWSSMLTVTMLTYLTLILVVTGLIDIFTVGIFTDVKLLKISMRAFVSIDIVVFAFQCHIQTVQIFSELSENPDPLFKKSFFNHTRSIGLEDKLLKSNEPQRSIRLQFMYEVNIVAMLICFIFFSLVGVFGYLILPYVESDILVSLGTTNIFVYLARIGMALVAIFCYPVQFFPPRAVVNDAIRQVLNDSTEAFSRTRHIILTFILFGISLGTALLVTDLGMVFSILGATGAVAVIFIIPGLILLYTPFKTTTLHNYDNEVALISNSAEEVEDRRTYKTIFKDWKAICGGGIVVCLGIIIFIVTLYVILTGLRR